ncbi:MAG: hypothetical protein B7X90_04825 [Novosphingobium sp. 17-62-19]|uniref:DNA cytosine methyltransferase n=1 Tax=Novosphingobium sp. 17-62-19 TaxID=1970406 RepID=UPI000BCC9A23|nr:DNA cytosine methyltransferase [Novosphingobium sp. 17-62-19]OZA20739.1 MAG: hypothetical protein B7X90_04825 [Novosphingobium sp. 17-62-19]
MTTIGTRTNGSPRVWIEGSRLDRAGFQPSTRYRLEIDEADQSILLRLDPQGERIVSRRAKGEAVSPVVEIASVKALSVFDGLEQLAIRFECGFIRISPAASDRRKLERSMRLRHRLAKGDPLRVGSVSTGLGVLALAMHEGLQNAGLESTLAFSVEIDQGYQDHSQQANPVWAADTVAIAAPMQEVAFDPQLLASLPQIDIIEAGIPCTAHSVAGRAKKGLAMPEHDPVAGHLVAGFLAIVAACNPAVVVVENVVQYMQSASFAILSNQLTEWGYDVRSTVLSGEDYGCLEHRRVWPWWPLHPALTSTLTPWHRSRRRNLSWATFSKTSLPTMRAGRRWLVSGQRKSVTSPLARASGCRPLVRTRPRSQR